MASNNQRAPSAPPPQRCSNDSKKHSKENQQLILSQVKEMFDPILEPDIILSVVQNCKWKLQPSIDALIMLSENAEVPVSRPTRHADPKSVESSPMNSKPLKTQKMAGLANHSDKLVCKSNQDSDNSTGVESTETSATSFLNLNDKELLRQREEFRKFELLKKDLTEKGFLHSGNENVSKPGYSRESNKISQPKLQQFGYNWSTKNESSKVYFCSDVENSTNPMTNQLWSNSNNSDRNKIKETNSQFNNLFGSKHQFSRDLDNAKVVDKGLMQKHCVNVDPAIITARNARDTGFKKSNTEKIYPNVAEYSSEDFNKDYEQSLDNESAHRQQVQQFDSNYDNEKRTRTGGVKSNVHKGETESLCGLKVQYRLPGLENSSDDDADVVIEEETENYPTQIPSLMSTNVYQFISSSTQSPVRNTRPGISLANTPSPPTSPQRNTYDDKLRKITSSIMNGHKVLIMLRGLPGSGKSHLAHSIVKSTVSGDANQFIFSTDEYFIMHGRGTYKYVRSKLDDAHKWNQKRVVNSLKEGVSPVIVDNTNTQCWEMQPYVVAGVQNGYIIEVLEPNTPWCKNVNELSKKNVHGVPKEYLRGMLDRWEHNLTGAKLIEQLSLRYTTQNVPPQIRRYPYFEKNDKQKPSNNKNRNKKSKKNSSVNNGNFFNQNNSNSFDHLLSDSDKNMKHDVENSSGSMNLDSTLENIVSNALKSENDTLNKSLVDYCIETDSGDEIDSDKVPEQNRSFDLLGEDIKIEEAKPLSPISTENAQIPSDSATKNSPPVKKLANNLHHQNLGAIGSERKGSVTTIDYNNLERKIENEELNVQENKKGNVLSQCWDFTLLVNGREIHSSYSKPVSDQTAPIDDRQSETDSELNSERSTGVIITEIFDDEVVKIASEDSEIAIDKIINKMDAIEQETNPGPNSVELKSNSETEEGVGSIGSIFNMIKKSFLGLNTEQENTMKYKHQTNDNSLSENDAFENEKSHREPILNNLTDSCAATIVGDSLSQKLSSLNSDFDKYLCDVTKLPRFDTTQNNEDQEFTIDDNLSKKLSNDRKDDFEILEAIENYTQLKSSANNTTAQCISSSIDPDDVLKKDLDEPIVAESNSDLGEKDVTDIVDKSLTEVDADEENPEFRSDNNDSIYNILTEAVNRIISRQETDDNFDNLGDDSSDDEKSQSSLTESSFFISGADIDEKTNVAEALNEEKESEGENIDQELKKDDKIDSAIDKNSETETQDFTKINPEEFSISENQVIEILDVNEMLISLKNAIDDGSSIEECCEDCESENIKSEDKYPVEKSILDKLRIDDQTLETTDNINQVTWRESPFPVEIDTIISLLEPIQNDKLETVSKSEAGTITTDYDFNVSFVGGTSEYKILSTRSRAINTTPSLNLEQKLPLKLMLDKSSMTSVVDILSGEKSLELKTDEEINNDLDKLIDMFPNLPREDVTDIYQNLCSCNFNWTMDMLLDGVPDHVTKYDKIEGPKIAVHQDLDIKNSPTPAKKEKIEKLRQQQSSSLESNDPNDKKFQSPKKKKERNKLSEERLELKRQIESKMTMNEASYNPHILRVKKWKNGEPDITIDSIEDKSNAETEEFEEPDISPKSSESNDDFMVDDIKPEEMMELNLGEDFIKVLETEFGNPEFQFPGGLFPVIQIKKSMAQQLHALWIESMEVQLNAQQEQLDEMIEKDAQYARSLEQEEARSVSEKQVPNLREIMDMEMALAIYNNDFKKQLELETPDDMASRLTRQMLHEMFSDNDPETLYEILKAHGGNFEETVSVIEASTGQVANRNNTLKKQKSLIDRAKKESIQTNTDELDFEATGSYETFDASEFNFGTLTYDDAMEEAQSSRKEAQRQLSLRNENFNKATQACKKGNREVAEYYSQMAKLHTKRMELANSTAASAFLAAQDYKMSTENTLDLHYLYVAEAIQALEVFLEYQMTRLNKGKKKYMNLYIITGRGARSSRGRSRIKPAVSKKLDSKNIRYMDENPGCLKVVLQKRNNAAG